MCIRSGFVVKTEKTGCDGLLYDLWVKNGTRVWALSKAVRDVAKYFGLFAKLHPNPLNLDRLWRVGPIFDKKYARKVMREINRYYLYLAKHPHDYNKTVYEWWLLEKQYRDVL